MANAAKPRQVPRRQVLAYRILSSGLARSLTMSKLPFWQLGLQDSLGSSALALGARLVEENRKPLCDGSWLAEPADAGELALVWSVRGSPHVHRRKDLPAVSAAIWPADDSDAVVRLAGSGAYLAKNDCNVLEALGVVAAALRQICRGPMAKPVLSAAVTEAIDKRYSSFCGPCDSVHVLEMLFRSAALPAGLGLVAAVKPATLAPVTPTFRTPLKQNGFAAFADAYLELNGAGTNAEVAAHFGTTAGQLRKNTALLPKDIEPVVIDGIRSQSTPELIARILDADHAAAAQVVALLPAGDPLLQPRERGILVPDSLRAKTLWKAIGSPGAVLAGAEIKASWRPRKTGKKLTIAVEEFVPLTKAERGRIGDEAQIIASIRGVDQVQVDFLS